MRIGIVLCLQFMIMELIHSENKDCISHRRCQPALSRTYSPYRLPAVCAACGVGAAHVAGALGSLPSLERLNLAAAGLRDDGAAAVGRSLRDGRLPRLTALSLAGNDITATGAQALAPFLRSNAALLELNMQVRARRRGGEDTWCLPSPGREGGGRVSWRRESVKRPSRRRRRCILRAFDVAEPGVMVRDVKRRYNDDDTTAQHVVAIARRPELSRVPAVHCFWRTGSVQSSEAHQHHQRHISSSAAHRPAAYIIIMLRETFVARYILYVRVVINILPPELGAWTRHNSPDDHSHFFLGCQVTVDIGQASSDVAEASVRLLQAGVIRSLRRD